MNAEGNDSNNEKEFITTLILVTGYLFIQLLANLTVKKNNFIEYWHYSPNRHLYFMRFHLPG